MLRMPADIDQSDSSLLIVAATRIVIGSPDVLNAWWLHITFLHLMSLCGCMASLLRYGFSSFSITFHSFLSLFPRLVNFFFFPVIVERFSPRSPTHSFLYALPFCDSRLISTGKIELCCLSLQRLKLLVGIMRSLITNPSAACCSVAAVSILTSRLVEVAVRAWVLHQVLSTSTKSGPAEILALCQH